MSLKRKTSYFCLGIVFLAVSAVSPVRSQMTLATILGTVEDESKAVLPGVTVTAHNVETGLTRTTLTDEDGRYRIPQLPIGEYELRAELVGFQSTVHKGILLTVGQELDVRFTLKVGEITETVEVTGEAPMVETTNSTLAGLVDEKAIRDLPLNGRSFDELVTLQAGSYRFRLGSGEEHQYSVSGGRMLSNRFMIDGTELVGYSYRATANNGVSGANLGVEAIREFTVLTSAFSSEHGKRPGGVVNVATRSGTNQLHGSVFEFLRNDNMDARNFFDDEVPEFKRNNFGFSLGGPIIRDKTFFFGNYEALRQDLGQTGIAIVPSLQARQGLLPDGRGGLKQVAIADSVKPYLALIPLPNGRTFPDGTAEFLINPTQVTHENFYLAKVDHNFSASDSIFATYGLQGGDQVSPALNFNPNFEEAFSRRTQFVTIQEQKVVSTRLLNTVRFGLNRLTSRSLNKPSIAISPDLDFVPGRGFGHLNFGSASTGGVISSVGTNSPQGNSSSSNVFQFSDQGVYTRGAHSVKAGMELQRMHDNIGPPGNGGSPSGVYAFDSFENFLLGRSFNLRVLGGDPIKGLRQTYFGVFVQDDLKLRTNLTVNLGVRYEFVTSPVEVNGRNSNFIYTVVNGYRILATQPKVGGPLYENNSLNGFAPRIGLAWDMLGDGRTSLRAGFGLYYDQNTTVHKQKTTGNPPFGATLALDNPVWPRADIAAGRLQGLAPDSIDPDLRVPAMTHYNLSLQRQIFSNTVITAGYTGSHGYHLLGSTQANAAIPQIQADGRKFFPAGLRRRNPDLGSGRLDTSEANSFYNALQLSLERRYSGGLRFKTAYTFAKSVDDRSAFAISTAANNTQQQQDPDDIKADRGLSAFDIRHNFSFNYTYELPFGRSATGTAQVLTSGWQLNGIVSVATGPPFSALLGFNRSRNLDTRVPDRASLKAGGSNNPVLGGPDNYFEITAFELQPAGFFGNAGRDTISGPGAASVDFSLVKSTAVKRVSEDLRVEFRAEVFNLFNHANFSVPDGFVFNSNGTYRDAGSRIRSTVTTSRQIQFGLKIVF
ncbi:MAG: TonB-dependent receptor [Acidobacteria bacterium]|nr:TonB-dependent receptor [Acidobacteriota bacterium]